MQLANCKRMQTPGGAHQFQFNGENQVKYMISKANKNIFILYRVNQFNFSQNMILTLYNWYIRTILEYAALVWHPGFTQAQHTSLEQIKKR